MCKEIYDYDGWKDIFPVLRNKNISMMDRVVLYIIHKRLFYINLVVYTLYYKIIKR